MQGMLKDLNSLFMANYMYISIAVFIVFLILALFVSHKKRRRVEKFVNKKIQNFKSVFDISEESILILSKDNKILYANSSMVQLLKLKKKFINQTLELPKIKIKDEWKTLDEIIINRSKKVENKLQLISSSTLMVKNESIPINLYLSDFYEDDKHKIPCTMVVMVDMRKKRENELLAYRHKLTNLPNQAQAINDLNAIYAKLHLGKQTIAVVVLNIDNFSTLRSIVGYEQSNVILINFAKYLSDLAKELSFLVYHTVHNNFLLTIQNIDSSRDAISIINQIQSKLISFYQMDNSKLHLTASAGVAIYPDNSTTLNLLDNAYKALAQAETSGLGRIELYKADGAKHIYDELKLYNDMHQALEKSEFEVYYQPIVKSIDKEVASAEALIRWNHPEHGMIAPYIFIPIMEKTGLIVELGEYVLEEVLKQQKRWELFKFKQIEVSINLSMIELETGKFVEHVIQQLDKHQVSANLIKFEITEGIAMLSEEQTSKQLLELRKLGIGISLDDFGTGYTSFSYLKKIPATTLKIDRSLIINILDNEEDQRIVKAIIELGHNLGMNIVVEGVEDKKMFKMIGDFGSDYIQGYYFSRPLPVFEFQKLLR
jgi:polar amino acid transport system substrate-binding protein